MHDTIPASELILNSDGSIYHLNLLPEQIAHTIILVGDQDRVPRVSRHFDRLVHQVQKREFVTHTGYLGEQRISALSTGIGTDNIDIVMNELDALVNIDFQTRKVKDQLTSLNLVRIGTSGSVNAAVGADELLVSNYAIGIDALLPYYYFIQNEKEKALTDQFNDFIEDHGLPLKSTAAAAAGGLVEKLNPGLHNGITLSAPGFYGPQGRQLRLKSKIPESFFSEAGKFKFDNLHLTNFEMESSAIFGMARMLGHQAVSCNAIIANRVTREFSSKPRQTVDRLIQLVLERLTT